MCKCMFVLVKHTNNQQQEVAAYTELERANETRQRLEKQLNTRVTIITVPITKENRRG